MSKIKILIATHKQYSFPKDDIFLPIQVGKKNATKKLDMQGDDEGDNISEKNSTFCELTALYWAWKNIKTEIIGLYHYRRYFKFNSNFVISKNIYYAPQYQIKNYENDSIKIEKLINNYDVILAKPRIYPYSLETGYRASHVWEDLTIVEGIIKKKHPDYAITWDKVIKNNNKLPHYNMFICKHDRFVKYCEWLFEILFEAEKQIKLSPYKYQQRVYGFLAERLQLVYWIHNNYKIKYIPVLFFEQKGEERPKHSLLLNYIQNKLFNFSFCLINYPQRIRKQLFK